jgi:negative regulator of genetic competence, sporulation and motility
MSSKMKTHKNKYSLPCLQAWIREEEKEACNIIKTAIYSKRGWEQELDETTKDDNQDKYIKFIAKFGPAMTGVTFWNNNKTNTVLSELLTVTDEAFIHLCMANYAPTWKAQEKQKSGNKNIQVPVSENHYMIISL